MNLASEVPGTGKRRRNYWHALKLAWRLARAERQHRYDDVVDIIDAMAKVRPLNAEWKATRAYNLLRSERFGEARSDLSALHTQLRSAADSNSQYLRHWSMAQLALMLTSASQYDYEARQARDLPCSARLRRQFPLVDGSE